MRTGELSFRVHGMDCAEEVAALRQEVGPLVGDPARLSFDLLAGKMTVAAGEPLVAAAAVQAAALRAGLELAPWEQPVADEGRSLWQRRGRLVSLTVCGLLLVAGFLVHWVLAGSLLAALAGGEGLAATGLPRASLALYTLAIVTGGWFIAPKAWISLRRLRPDMNLLMTIAVLGAAGIGDWFEAATVVFLFALSLTLESWSIGRARRAVEALLDLSPRQAHLLHADGSEHVVPATTVVPGDRVLVKPGERIPVDGVVLSGSSAVDQSPITGESVPADKEPEALVYAGTINGSGALHVECTRVAGDTTLARIIRMVGEAQSKRAPAEQWVERFARVYTPVVMVLALTILLVPPLLFAAPWEEWIYRALVLLVIACPCALVISTPVSIVAALASAARNGVLIKGGVHLEAAGHLRAIAFDKTGTLTGGEPLVLEVVPLNDHTESQLLATAAALEVRSEHRLAHAILSHCAEHGFPVTPAENVRAIPGKGATGHIHGREFWIGSHRYLEQRGQETPAVHDRLEQMAGAGQTVVVVGDSTHVCGLIAIADAVRPEAKETIAALRAAGIQHIAMLTGDNEATGRAIALSLGIEDVRSELLPEEKVAAIEGLVLTHGSVAMVGDGINDAPALARSSLAVAMGAAGTDAAIEAADVALMSDDLTSLPWLIHHSRRTLRIIRQNITLALLTKAIFVVLTFAGHASLWAAIAADMGASLLVICNGLRLLR